MNNQKATRSIFTPATFFQRLRPFLVFGLLLAVAFGLVIFRTRAASSDTGLVNRIKSLWTGQKPVAHNSAQDQTALPVDKDRPARPTAAVTTNGGSGLAGTYPDLASAITALNAASITSPVVITASGTETTPAGGYSITATGTSTNTIVIDGGGGTTLTAFTPQVTGSAASSFDAVFKIVGGDFITIQGFTMNENAGNTVITPGTTNTMTEFGVLLVHSSATDGAQNNTIQNNTISLNSTYTNSVGIFSTSASSPANATLDATSTAGTNSNNKIYGNIISNVAYGVYFICPPLTATVFETGNDIGGTSAATANNVTFGNATASSGPWNRSTSTNQAGILFRNGAGNSVRFNTVTSNSAAYVGSAGLNGIQVSSGTAPTGVTYTSTISNNNVTVTTTGIALVTGIDFGHGLAGTGTIVGSNNTVVVNQNATAAVSAAIIGIKANYVAASSTLNTNNITINQAFAPAATATNSSPVTALTLPSGTTGTPTMNALGNTILINRSTNVTTGLTATMSGAQIGIQATVAATTMNIGASGAANVNAITVREAIAGAGTSTYSSAITYITANAAHSTVNVVNNNLNTTSSTIRSTGSLIGVFQDSTVTTLVNVSSNTMNVDRIATSGSAIFQSTSSTPAEVADTISNNNITFTNLAGTTSSTGISSLGGPGSPAVNNKTINGNTINISGTHSGTTIGITCAFTNTGFIQNNSVTASSAGATVTGITTTGTAMTISGNTLSLASSTTSPTAMTGINESGTGAHSITNNTFSAMNFTGVITGSPVVSGIAVSSNSGANLFSNSITNISVGGAGSTASPVVDGILISGGTSINVFKNKIYGITTAATGTSTTVNGIRLSAGTTNNIFNNLIGDLTAPAAASTDAIRGISITSTTATSNHNISYNTVSLNATSTGANFGTTGIFHTTSTTATTSALNLRNNIIVNNSTPVGTGLTVAYRRSSGAANTLANYGSTSNNNDFYAGTPGASNLIYSDGTSTAQTIAAYRSGAFTAGTVAPRDSASFSENPNFVSTVGANANFLHINTTIATQIESGGAAISGITDDFDGDTRNATTPDVGADEFTGIGLDMSAPVISYALLGNGAATGTQAFSNVTVTDATGVNTTAGTRPRVYYKKGCDANNTFNDNTNATVGWKFAEASGAGGSPFSFTIDYALLPACGGGSGAGVVATGDVIQYFVVAQDTVTPTPNVGINSGTFAATPSSVALTSAAFPIGGTINSYNIVGAFSGTRTVCASGCDFTSLTGVAPGGIFAAINAGVVTADVNIEIAGDLTEDGTNGLNPVASPFIVKIYPTGAIRSITSTAGITATSIIRLNAADRVNLDGSLGGVGTDRSLTLTSVSATPQAVVWLQNNGTDGATGNTIKNLTVVGNSNTTTAIGIGSGSSTVSATSTGTNNNSNTIQNNNISKVTTGIFSQGASATVKNTGNVITQNLMNAASPNNLLQGGIRVGFEEGVSITQNTIANTLSTAATTFGITLGLLVNNTFTAFTGNEVTGATVSRNMIDGIVRSGDGTAFGIGVATVATAGANPNTIANNFISGVRSTSATPSDFPAGILLGGGATGSTRVYFNSVSMNATSSGTAVCSSSSPCFGIAVGGSNPVVDLRNNVFSNRAISSTGKTYAIGFAYSTFTNLTMTRNVFFSNSANFAVTGGLAGTDQTFAGLETATGTTGNISSDPRFIDPVTNLHIDTTVTTPVESAGVTISGITLDIDGDTRNVTTPDIGADEGTFIAPVTNDVQATAFIDPTNGGLKIASVAFAPQASFTNNGTANQTNVPVRYRICNDVGCTSVVSNQTTTIATLNSGATATATFGSVTLSAGTYTIRATAELVGDTVPANNEITGTLSVRAPLSGTYNVGTGETYTSLTNTGGIFGDLNSLGVTGNVIINITSDLTAETGTILLNQVTENAPCANNCTITIQPGSAGNLPDPNSPQALRTVSGTNATALINLNGADRVTLNGINGADTLLIRNTGGGAAILLTNDSSNINIQNTTFEGASTGTLVNIGAGTTTGNDNIQITGNTIRDRSDTTGVPFNGVGSTASSTTITNGNILIDNNQIFNFTQAGVFVGVGTDSITVTNNNIYQSAARTSNLTGVAVNGAFGTNSISQNSIHDLNTTLAATGIVLNDARATTVSRNRIFSFPSTSGSTSTLTGIVFNGGSGTAAAVTLTNNMVSLIPSFNNAQTIFGIRDFGFGGNTFTALYNSVLIGGTSTTANSWACLRAFSAPTVSTFNNNICFNNRTGGTGNNYAGGDQSDATGTFTSNYNLFVGTGATAANYFDRGTSSTGTPVSFATWQGGTRDLNSQASNPGAGNYTVAAMFTSATDLHSLSTSPALSAGTPVSVTVDFDNDPRPAANPDMGADELVQAVGGAIPAGTYYNVLAGNGDALGGNVTVTNQLNLTGILTGGGNTLTLGCNTTVSGAGASAYVNGALAKQYCAVGTFTFPVGVGGYSPVTINATTLPAGTTTKTVTPTQAPMPGVTDATRSINRYWDLNTTATAGTYLADLTFQIVTGVDEGSNFTLSTANVLRRNSDNTINEIPASSRTANSVTVNNINAFSLWTLANANAAPTLAVVKEFNASRMGEANLVRWSSSYETRNLGFRVYREENGARREVSSNIIAGSALLVGAETQLTAGKSYAYWDKSGTANSVYWVEDIDLNGTTKLHGPIRLTTADNRFANVTDSATLNELRADGNGTGVIEQQLLAKALRNSAARPEVGSDAWQRQLALAGSAAVKLQVRANGWYRVSGSQLAAAGLPANADAKFLQLYVNGVQVPMLVRTAEGSDEGRLGNTGVIEFYGVGQDARESDSSIYWLIAGNGNGLRIGAPVRVAPDNTEGGTTNAKGGNNGAAGSFAYTVERKDRSIYVPAILNGDAENFFGAVVNSTAVDQALTVNKLDTTANGAASLSVALQGATAGAHQVTVSVNGTQVGVISFAGEERKVTRFDLGAGVLREGVNTVTLRSLNGAADVSLTEYLRLTYAHRYEADNNRLLLASGNRQALTVRGFTTDRVRVFDLTEPNRAFEVAATARATEGGGFDVTVPSNLNSRQLLAIADDQALTPVSIAANEASSWTRPASAADFVIIAPARFRAAAQPLANLRSSQGLQTVVVSLEDIYDEWNAGAPSTAAVQGFLAYARQNWATQPRYVLYLGDASYDPRNYLGNGQTDIVPTAFIETPDFETASDEALTDGDNDGIGELSSGRMPARTVAEAQMMVNRAVNFAAFNGGAVLVADKPDGYDFAGVNATVRGMLPNSMAATVINREGQTDEAVRSQINTAWNAGPSVVQYAGHAGPSSWTGAPLFNVADALALNNGNRLPLLIGMTCMNGYLQDPNGLSLAESLMQAPNGGAIAVWGSSGLTFPAGQVPMDYALIQALYGGAGQSPRLGDAIRAAKGQTGDTLVRRTWILFGDPTLRIR